MTAKMDDDPDTMMENEALISILNTLIAGRSKMHEAPMSSECHFDTAIVRLHGLIQDWQPPDSESQEVMESATEHARLLKHQWRTNHE
jgi:hypothetical protein